MTRKDIHDEGWKVGMTICVVRAGCRGNALDLKQATITKIGRNWIYFDDGGREDRFDATTRRLDGKGYSSPGEVYTSAAEYEETTERYKLWRDLRGAMGYKPPKGMTADRIRQFIEELT
jgi:hypothetical protein